MISVLEHIIYHSVMSHFQCTNMGLDLVTHALPSYSRTVIEELAEIVNKLISYFWILLRHLQY